jgi:hypothetical protein
MAVAREGPTDVDGAGGGVTTDRGIAPVDGDECMLGSRDMPPSEDGVCVPAP